MTNVSATSTAPPPPNTPSPNTPLPDTTLPIAGTREVRARARRLAHDRPRQVGLVVGLYLLAAVAGLVAPRLVGTLVDDLGAGTTTGRVDTVVLVLLAAVLLQTVLTRVSRLLSFRLGEDVFAELREEFLIDVVALPLSTVEAAGSGDLLTRMTADVDTLARTVRDAVPEVVVAGLTTVLTVVAAFLAGPLVALAALVAVPVAGLSTRWYLKRAPQAYLAERATFAGITAGITETAEGARSIEALGRQRLRVQHTQDDLARNFVAERRTLRLRCLWFPWIDLTFALPLVGVLLLGGFLVRGGHATLGEVTAVALYVQQLVDPLDRLLSWLDEIQIGAASLARLVGVGDVPPDRVPSDDEPADQRLVARDVHFSYVPGREVLSGLDLAVRPGERLAVVGPSGAGKSTLTRLLAGVNGPDRGRVDLGGVPLVDLPLERLRLEVALVTQEHHVFVGSVADNLLLARPGSDLAQLRTALDAVDALGWVDALADGLDTLVGSGGLALSAPQAQQLSLARLVLADPHTLVLDEATSLLDPTAARHLERSLAAVLRGRTVVAVAHRLHTGQDADRVAVVESGRVTELGTHDELLARGGSYASLWLAWQTP